MAYFEDEEIAGMLDTWGNRITVGGVTKACILDESDELREQESGTAPQSMREITALIRTTDFPDLANDDEVTVDDVDYTVWRVMAMDDGAVTKLWLRVAPE